MNDEFKTKTNEPFAVLQVPESYLEKLPDKFASELELVIGLKVLIMAQDVRLLMRGEARSEVERMYDEIEAFLDKPTDPSEMTVDEMRAEVKRLEDRRGEIGNQIGEISQNLATLICPYSVGDVLVNKKGERARIKRIRYSGFEFGCGYLLNGVYIKKDGSDGIRRCHFYGTDAWKKEGADE